MPTLYFSLCSSEAVPVVQRIAAECESFLQGKCVLGSESKEYTQEKVRAALESCDVLIVVIGGGPGTNSDFLLDENILNERVRCEIISAIHLNLLIVPLLIDTARLPEKRNVPGAFKRLLDCKSYRLRTGYWSEDLDEFLEDIQEELDFKRDVEKKLSQSVRDDIAGGTDSDDAPVQSNRLGLEHCGALELRRMIESEKLVLEEARPTSVRNSEKNSLSILALAFTRLGQTRRAIQYFEEQLEIVRKENDIEEICALLANLGDALAVSGNIERARSYYQEQLSLANSNDCRAFVGSAYNGLGFVCVKQESIPQALEHYLKALAIYRELSDHDKELELLVGIGLNFQKLGELEKTTEYLEQALDAATYVENRREEARTLVDLTDVYIQLGKPDRAREHLNRTEDILKGRDEPWAEGLSNRLNVIRKVLNQN